MRVLIIDDETSIRTSMGEFFEDFGFQVHTVGSAEAALAAIAEQDFDVAIVDIRLPGLDGDGLIIKGEKAIRPADPKRTRVVGNFAFTYAKKKIDLTRASWYERTLLRAHTKMEFDPDVWAQVEEMIVAAARG